MVLTASGVLFFFFERCFLDSAMDLDMSPGFCINQGDMTERKVMMASMTEMISVGL